MKTINISENELNDIKQKYNLINSKKDYVFDFYITENQNYLIIFDQLFIKDGTGKSVGSIWENTYVFDELILEGINKLNTLSESTKNQMLFFTKNIKWLKQDISNILNDKITINEQDSLLSNLASMGGDMAKGLFKQFAVPALRKVRSFLYTNFGVALDIITSFITVKSNAFVWFIICGLDYYEIHYNDFDDPDREKYKWLYFIADAVGALLGGVAAVSVKRSFGAILRGKGTPQSVGLLRKLFNGIGKLGDFIISSIDTLIKSIGGSKILENMKTIVKTGMTKLSNVLKKILTVQVGVSTAVGVGGNMLFGGNNQSNEDEIQATGVALGHIGNGK